MDIRPYKKEDKETLSQLYKRARIAGFSWVDEKQFLKDDFVRDTKNEKILVAWVNKKIVGFSSFIADTNYVHNLYIHPDYHGLGYGGQLLKATVDKLSMPAWLHCQTDNKVAVKFYIKKGWEIINQGKTDIGQYYVMEFA